MGGQFLLWGRIIQSGPNKIGDESNQDTYHSLGVGSNMNNCGQTILGVGSSSAGTERHEKRVALRGRNKKRIACSPGYIASTLN